MFGIRCDHLNKLLLIYLSLCLLQFCLADSMGQAERAHFFWEIIGDSCHFFGLILDAEDLAAGTLPVSNLATTRSIIQTHMVLLIWDTPAHCLLAPWLPIDPPLGLATGSKWKTDNRSNRGRGGGRVVGGSAGGHENKSVTFAVDWDQTDVVNIAQHPSWSRQVSSGQWGNSAKQQISKGASLVSLSSQINKRSSVTSWASVRRSA